MTFPDFPDHKSFFLRLRKELESTGVVPGDSRFLVAVSGGLDSMTLLAFFVWLRARSGCAVAAAHFDHELRPKDDERETAFVRDFCAAYKLQLFTESVDVRGFALETRRSVEDAARFLRYRFLDDSLARWNGTEACPSSFLCLGHQMEDQAETLLLMLGRGSGLLGLCGMRTREGNRLRPLLKTGRKALEEFAVNASMNWCEDESNRSGEYLRNRLRHELIPLWEELLGYDLPPLVARLAENLQKDEEFLSKEAAKQYERLLLPSGALNARLAGALHDALLWRVMRIFLCSGKRRSEETLAAHAPRRRPPEDSCLSHEQFRQLRAILNTAPSEKRLAISGDLSLRLNGWQLFLWN